MQSHRWLTDRISTLAVLVISLVLILSLSAACVPAAVRQTTSTPAAPITNVTDISPVRTKQPSASPKTPSQPSVSPSANAIIPSPGQTAVPTELPIPSPTASPESTNATQVDLKAQNMSFDKKTITVPAGADVSVNFTNADAGIQNNFSVYKDDTAKESIFTGDPITGPDSTTYSFTAPDKAGTYYFRSDNHPAMNGQFIVK